MPFNIPNVADASNVLQAQPDSRDFSAIIAAAFSGTGIVSGCAVTAQAAPNMTVAVAAGSAAVAGGIVSVTGGNVTITAANASQPRFDLICVDNTGVKSAVAGTPAAAPVFPDPAGKAVLASVLVPAAAASITNVLIVDKRLTAVVVAVSEATGVIKGFGGTVAPAGYLLCDGSAVSRTTFANLFTVISTLNGPGDGSTTFNLPDGAGRNMIGLGSHADVNLIGKNDGLPASSRSPIHNSTSALSVVGTPGAGSLAVASHNHTIPDSTDGSVGVSSGGGVTAGTDHAQANQTNAGTGFAAPGVTGAPSIGSLSLSGSIGPGGTRPNDRVPFFVANYIIKT